MTMMMTMMMMMHTAKQAASPKSCQAVFAKVFAVPPKQLQIRGLVA